MNLLSISIFAIGLSLAGELYRLMIGPTSWDRLLAANQVSIKGLMILALFAYSNELGYLLDVALTYGVIGYVGIILIANYLAEGRNDHD